MLRIRYWRTKRGLTLVQLQQLTNIPFQTLSLYERGKVDPPTYRLSAIARALNVSVTKILPRQPSKEKTYV